MRNTFSEALYKAASENPEIYIVVADISPAGSMVKFREQYPERFINVGVSEQSMIGICAGLALKGCQPFAYTIATFTLYRPFEMVRDDLCYQNLPVTIVGMGAGVVYSNLGSTHHAMEDIAIAGALPNMQIIAPCDPLECTEATRHCAQQTKGPIYLRLGKVGEPIFTDKAVDPWQFGKLRYIKRGSDVCILSYGIIMNKAMQLAAAFEAEGKSVSVVSCHTVKPLDVAGIEQALHQHKHVIVIEEHVPQGGLAPQTKQIAWDSRAQCRLDTFTLQDSFIHNYGSHDDLLAAHGLDLPRIYAKVGLSTSRLTASNVA
jgi:transketolase